MVESSKKLIIVITLVILVSILIAISAFRSVNPPQPNVAYFNAWEFRKMDVFWHTNYKAGKDVFDLSFKYLPQEVRSIPVFGQPSENFSLSKEIFVTFDFNTSNDKYKHLGVASAELNFNLLQVLGKNVTNSCLQNVSGCEARPIIDCIENKSVIRVTLSERALINVSTPECITLTGPDEKISMAVDRMLYAWYGIMK